MRRLLLTLLAIIAIAGALAGAGFAGYRFGYQRGALSASNVDLPAVPFARGDDFHWERMPFHRFDNGMNRNFDREFGPGRFRMMSPGRGLGFFLPIGFLVQLFVLGFIVWLIYKLLTGWRISFTRATPESPRVEPLQSVESQTKPTEDQSN
jgi:hypothetical protein